MLNGMREDRRQALLEAVTAYAARHGIAGLTLRPLAEAIGTSDRMLVYYFHTREDLVVEVVDRAVDSLFSTLEAADAHTPGELAGRLWEALRHDDVAYAMRLYLEAAGLSVTDPRWRRRMAPAIERYQRALERWIRAAGVRRERAPVVARLISAAMDGLLLQSSIDGASADADAALEFLVSLLEREPPVSDGGVVAD